MALSMGLETNPGKEVISLQYANDTILFTDIEPYHLRNLKSTPAIFEQTSGMRINFHKS
jgi:hypothetical protein